jgi:hypothetical protein
VSRVQDALLALAAQTDWDAVEQGAGLRQTEQRREQMQSALAREEAAADAVCDELRLLLGQGGDLNVTLVVALRRQMTARQRHARELAPQVVELAAQADVQRATLAGSLHRVKALRREADRERQAERGLQAAKGFAAIDDLWSRRRPGTDDAA